MGDLLTIISQEKLLEKSRKAPTNPLKAVEF